MSREFLWRPITPTPPPSGAIGLMLWTILCERVSAGHPGGGEGPVVLGVDDVQWLRGFVAAGGRSVSATTDAAADARALLDALTEHGQLVIEVSYE